jgi:hypothetical protein
VKWQKDGESIRAEVSKRFAEIEVSMGEKMTRE